MIKVTANKGCVDVAEVAGTGHNVMSELCCIVDAVCTGWCSDEDEEIRDDMKRSMIKTVAYTLLEKN